MLQVWSWMLMTTMAAFFGFVVIDWENQAGTCPCMRVMTHTSMRAVTGYWGTCLWWCLNIWKCRTSISAGFDIRAGSMVGHWHRWQTCLMAIWSGQSLPYVAPSQLTFVQSQARGEISHPTSFFFTQRSASKMIFGLKVFINKILVETIALDVQLWLSEHSSLLVRSTVASPQQNNAQPHSHLQLQLYDCNKKHGKWAILGAPSQMWSEWCA